ncbi:hypothetical protein Tco_0504631 [Tanacetum coccineum]
MRDDLFIPSKRATGQSKRTIQTLKDMLRHCMEGNVGRLFCRMELEKVVWLGPSRVEVGDKVMLEVSSWKDVVHFGKKDLLAPRCVGPFEIIKGIGPMAY